MKGQVLSDEGDEEATDDIFKLDFTNENPFSNFMFEILKRLTKLLQLRAQVKNIVSDGNDIMSR